MNEILKETNFDENFPQDDSYISDFPAGARKQNKALKDEQIVDAGKLQGLIPSNENGQIPINNGNENINLNAGMLNGKTSSDFAPKSHSHDVATQDSNGYMSNSDKRKLDGIASGAEVNQNAFANVKVGSNTIQADAKQDTLELVAGTNISLVGDANNDKVTIGVTGKVASASQADSATEAGNINKGFQVNEENFHSSDFRQTILGRANSGICARPFCGKLPNNTAVSSPGMAFGGIDTHGFIQLEYGTPRAYVGGGNANKINWYKKLAFADGTEASGTWGINISGTAAKATKSTSADSATKATQDSVGQTINTTYVKGVTANNATLTITKGNGSTSTTTVNNVSNATNANNLDIIGSYAHIKYGGGDVDENTAISQNKVNLLIGSWFSTGFRDLCSSGTPIRVAINHRNGNIKTTGNVTANGAMYSATPGTGDNSTRVATTAFVQSLINSLSNTVSGLTNAVNKKSQVYIGGGSGTAQQYNNFVIPLPSGYSRSQCKYAVFPTSIGLSANNGYFSLSVDQSTGIVRGSVRSNITGGGYRYSDIGIGYLVVAVK